MKPARKLLCIFGFHARIYNDGAMFTSAKRCGYCHEPLDPKAMERLNRERMLWGEVPKDWSWDQKVEWVSIRLHV